MVIKMKKSSKIVIMFVVIFLMISICGQVFADIDPDYYKPGEVLKADAKDLTDKVGIILGAIRNISVVVSVIALMIIGIKYMFGSIEEKANYKATIMPYIIGFVLAISGTTIVSYIYEAVR